MIVLDSSNSWVNVSSHTHYVPGLSRDLKGSIRSVILNAYNTWLTSPNQERTSVMLRGIGNSMMALRNRLHGCTESDVIWKPANSTMSWPNTNFSGLMVFPFHPHMSSHLHT